MEAETFQASADVELKLTWHDGVSIVSTGWQGIITEVAEVPDGAITSGTKVVRIDNSWKVAAATPAPFYRPLTSGGVGPDVAALNDFLASLGFSAGFGPTWSSYTERGVTELAVELGVPLPKNEAPTFDPSWTVWIPADPFPVAVSELQVGAPAPAQGTIVLKGVNTLRSLAMDDPQGELSTQTEGSSTIQIGAEVFEYSGDPQNPVENIAELRSVIPGAPETFPAKISFVSASTGHTVPVSALVTDKSGRNCVFVEDTENNWSPKLIQVAGGEIGKVRVVGLGDNWSTVLVNPQDAMAVRTCS
ncbi:hypothetical protein ACWGQ2_18080 [Arthrobacter sp. NPDC055585]